MLQSISGGRFTLGMGAGYATSEHDAIGVPLPRSLSASTASRKPSPSCEPCCAATRSRWKGGTTACPSIGCGRRQRHRCRSSWVAEAIASSRSAARHADVVGFTGFSVRRSGPSLTHFSAEGLDRRRAHVRAMAGNRVDTLRFQVLVQQVTISDDREAAGAALVAQWAEDGARSPWTRSSSARSSSSGHRARSPPRCQRRLRAMGHRDLDDLQRAPRRPAARGSGGGRRGAGGDATALTWHPGRMSPFAARVARARARLAEVGVDAVLLSVGPDLPVPHRVRGHAPRAAHHAGAAGRRRGHPRGAAARGATRRRATRRVRAPLVGRDRRPDRDRRRAGRRGERASPSATAPGRGS